MAKTKYLSLQGLTEYDVLIKEKIDDADAVNAEAAAAAKTAADNAADAAGVADGKAVKAQEDVDALKTYVGTLPEGTTAKDVVDYVNVKTAGIATDAALEELQSQLNGVQGEVSTIKGDYLKASDKTELQENINAVSAVANAAVKQSDYDVKVKALEDEDARIAGLVSTEATDRANADAELQEQITANANAIELLTEGVDADKVDGVKDLIAYVEEHGAEVTGMKEDIAANAKAIEDHEATNHDFATADATLKSELEGKINAKADATTVEDIDGRVEVVEGAVATKAEKTYVDETVKEVSDELTSYKNAHASDYTNAQIDTAIENEVSRADGAYAAKSLEGTVSTHIADADVHFTTTERTKLSGIEEGANKTIVDSALSASSTNPVENKAVYAKFDVVAGAILDHDNRVGALEEKVGEGFEAITTAEIQALFE